VTILRVGSATDVGMVRKNNEDDLLVADPVFAVADGMGGHAGGEVASRTAVEALERAFAERPHTVDGLIEAIEDANRAVFTRAVDDPDLRGMGTTLTVLAVVVEEGEERQLQDGEQ
jgi:protein phosphatase